MEDIRQTKNWARYVKSSGWETEQVRRKSRSGGIRLMIKRMPVVGVSVMKGQRFEGVPMEKDLVKVKKKHRVIYTILEPSSNKTSNKLKRGGWKQSNSPFLPSKTVVIDLGKSGKWLEKQLSSNAKRALKDMKEKVVIKEVVRREFYQAWKKSAKTWMMSEKDFEWLLSAFGKKARLMVSKVDDEILSGVLLLGSADTINYYQTFTSKKGRKTRAHYKLVWEAILWSKREGYKYFDFEGIYDERWPQRRWKGFSEFKKKFGGKEVQFPGSFVRWF